MASYMYVSATGHNWADDDEDDDFAFNPESPSTSPEQSTQAATPARLDPAQCASSTTSHSEADRDASFTVDYIDPDMYPTYAEKRTEAWAYSQPPAYVELSHQDGVAYPFVRVHYKANWMAVKLHMGANIRNPIMMKPSPLRQSMTWRQDGEDECIKEDGLLDPSLPDAPLDKCSEMVEEEEDGPPTPKSSCIANVTDCDGDAEEVS